MDEDILAEIRRDLPGPERLKYTRRAFEILPRTDRPNILDIGCGRGEPTVELARLTNGQITGLDISQSHLDELERKAKELGLSDRVKTIRQSLFEMDFPTETFDIIWAEGSIWLIGFEEGLKEWRAFIKPNGFLVVHEMCWLRPNPPREIRDYWQKLYPGIGTVQENLDMTPGCGYAVVGHFALPEDAWWNLYYGPLEERIGTCRDKYRDDPKSLAALDKEQKEIELYRKHCKWYGSAFYVMHKT